MSTEQTASLSERITLRRAARLYMTNHSIIVRSDLEVSILPDAYQLRDQALEASALIGKVTDEETKKVAVEAQILLKEVVEQCEQSRVAVKAPVLETRRLIDAL